MSELSYTFLTDGSSDASLRPILKWLLVDNGVQCAIQETWADLRFLRRQPRDFVERIRKAVDLYPCDLLFIHRDAEAQSYHERRTEIATAFADAFPAGELPSRVCVVPVRMAEAWLLFDEHAIRQAAGNPNGRVALQLPSLTKCEDLPDPKQVLYELIRNAGELGARRRQRMNVELMASRITGYIEDFSPLRQLSAFGALEAELREVIETNRWHMR